ncbi:jerky protein-like [Aphis craccivora]|uniref:Jerky protein-like n=1 Tax=Aphis craccivora TaxID=307492 RepID=A0A6G0XZY5_APHCR|nr:jerky protein-like [Aphis craccivora]
MTPNDFINTKNKMDYTTKPYYTPNTYFSRLISKNIDTYIKKYNRIANINGWSDEEKIKFLPLYLEVMKGLKPNIIRQIGIMENNTLKRLKDNLRKFDLIEFMVTGELDQSQTDIKNAIFYDQINKIMEKFNEQLKISFENNEKLNKKIKNLNPNFVKQNHFFNQNFATIIPQLHTFETKILKVNDIVKRRYPLGRRSITPIDTPSTV